MQQQNAHSLANGRAELPETVAARINSAVQCVFYKILYRAMRFLQ